MKKHKQSINNIIAYMADNEIEFKDLSCNSVTLLYGSFILTDKQMKGLIIQIFKNDLAIEFRESKFFITETIPTTK